MSLATETSISPAVTAELHNLRNLTAYPFKAYFSLYSDDWQQDDITVVQNKYSLIRGTNKDTPWYDKRYIYSRDAYTPDIVTRSTTGEIRLFGKTSQEIFSIFDRDVYGTKILSDFFKGNIRIPQMDGHYDFWAFAPGYRKNYFKDLFSNKDDIIDIVLNRVYHPQPDKDYSHLRYSLFIIEPFAVPGVPRSSWTKALQVCTDPVLYLRLLKLHRSVEGGVPGEIYSRMIDQFSEVVHPDTLSAAYGMMEVTRTNTDINDLLYAYNFILNRYTTEIQGALASSDEVTIKDRHGAVISRHPVSFQGTAAYHRLSVIFQNAVEVLKDKIIDLEAAIATQAQDLAFQATEGMLDPAQNPNLVYDPVASESMGIPVYTNTASGQSLHRPVSLDRPVVNETFTKKAYDLAPMVRAQYLRQIPTEWGLASPADLGMEVTEKGFNWPLVIGGAAAAYLGLKQFI